MIEASNIHSAYLIRLFVRARCDDFVCVHMIFFSFPYYVI